jgi:hypothetical protein
MDDESVAIAIFGEREIKDRRKYNPDNLECLRQLFPPKTAIRQIHFDRNHYWIPIGNGNHREFFRKIRGGE